MKNCIFKSVLWAFTACLSFIAQAQARDITDICDECIVERFASCGGFLEGANFDSTGKLWVVDLISGNLLTVNDSGQCSIEANTGGQPNGARFHKDGRLFIADKVLGIIAYDPKDGSFTTLIDSYRTEHLRGVNDLIFDKEGGMYFTEPYGSNALNPTGRVFYLSPEPNSSLSIVADTFAFPNGIALSMNESNLYVGEYGRKRVISLPSMLSNDVFDSPYVFAYTEGGVGPDGMAMDNEGNIYAAIFQGKQVRVIGADGYHFGSIALPEEGGSFVTNMAFHDGYLYITEASQGEIWRVKVKKEGHPFYHQRP